MPGMDGFQVMEELKKIETDGYLPVFVLMAQSDHKLRALQAGAKDFVSKPFDLAEVLMRVHNMLEVRLLHLETKKLYDQIASEQKVSEQLLLNVLPQAIVGKLKSRHDVTATGFPEIIAEGFPEATILFAGLHDFSRLTEPGPNHCPNRMPSIPSHPFPPGVIRRTGQGEMPCKIRDASL
jgi:adenylate cyclase